VSLAEEVLGLWAPLFKGVELRTGTHGVFLVQLDDDVVFDKKEVRRFPKKGEVAQTLRPILGEPPNWH